MLKRSNAVWESLEPRMLFAGVELVKDLVPGPEGETAREITTVKGVGYVFAQDEADASHLWRTDGTSSGTWHVATVGKGLPEFQKRLGNRIVFATSYQAIGQVWSSDGTAGGTIKLADVSSATGITPSVGLDHHVLFLARPTPGSTTNVLWSSDGTPGGTSVLVNDKVNELVRCGDIAIFTVGDGIFRTDGTAAGTQLITRLQPDRRTSPATQMVSAGNLVYFVTVGRSPGLWRTDGTAAGTISLANFDTSARTVSQDGSRLYFTRSVIDSFNNATPEMWMTDGTVAGTRRIHTFSYGGPEPMAGPSIGNSLFYTVRSDDGRTTLWRSDGETSSFVKDFGGQFVSHLVEAGGWLYVVSSRDRTLWRSDGTATGTTAIAQFPDDGTPVPFGRPFDIDGRYVFTARDGELHKLGSTIAGNVFADVAADGLRNAGDYMVGGFRVFLDRNGDGWWNRSEIFTRTNELGRYTLTDVPAGLYWLRVTHVGGWRFTTNDALRVRVTPGGDVIRHFGVTRNVLILGNVFLDADASGGRDDGELGLRGWTVFADADDDGVLDPDEASARTDALGRYAIRTLAGGPHRIRVQQDPNYRRTAPAAGFRDVSLLPGAVVTRVNFGQERIV